MSFPHQIMGVLGIQYLSSNFQFHSVSSKLHVASPIQHSFKSPESLSLNLQTPISKLLAQDGRGTIGYGT